MKLDADKQQVLKSLLKTAFAEAIQLAGEICSNPEHFLYNQKDEIMGIEHVSIQSIYDYLIKFSVIGGTELEDSHARKWIENLESMLNEKTEKEGSDIVDQYTRNLQRTETELNTIRTMGTDPRGAFSTVLVNTQFIYRILPPPKFN